MDSRADWGGARSSDSWWCLSQAGDGCRRLGLGSHCCWSHLGEEHRSSTAEKEMKSHLPKATFHKVRYTFAPE